MKNCPNLQKSLDWCEGMPQLPGIRRRLYYTNKNLIVAWPVLERDDFGRVVDANYVGAFELAEGAYWQYIDVNIDKSTVTSEPQGEVPSQTQLNKATFVHNGIDDEATAAAGFLNNSDCVIVYEDMRGHFRVLGNNKWRTLITVSQDQGQGTNPASTTINVEVTDVIAPPFYAEGLETEDGEVFPHANDEGNQPTPQPRLTSPSVSTFDIGTIASNGTTVSKSLYIKGENLTENLTLTKSGSGLTLSKSTVTAQEANAGINVTLTYTKTASGAASLNGSLNIHSSEIDKTITITAHKAALTSPSASTFDVGTIAASGTSVQKTMRIEGANLTQALSLQISGTGFSCSKASVTASQANNGIDVTITYTNRQSGAASATGELVISSSEVSKTISLTAAKEAAAASPTLTSPSSSTIDVGTIPSDGTTVTKQVYIKGENFTEGVTIRTSGQIICQTASLTAAQINSGTNITLSYTNSASGPATATGSLYLESKAFEQSFTLTAAKAGTEPSHDTINDYVQNGLVFHLDGINKGNVQGSWVDLIGGVDFPNHGASSLENGWQFDGEDDYMGYANDATKSLNFVAGNCTVEVAFYDDMINQQGGSTHAGVPLFYFGANNAQGSNALNPVYLAFNYAYSEKYINGMYVGSTTNVYADPLIETIAPHTLSINKERAFDNANVLSSLGKTHWDSISGGRTIGAKQHPSTGLGNFAKGKIYSIRIYNRILTEAEMRQNQRVDNERFNLGISNLPEADDDESV